MEYYVISGESILFRQKIKKLLMDCGIDSLFYISGRKMYFSGVLGDPQQERLSRAYLDLSCITKFEFEEATKKMEVMK